MKTTTLLSKTGAGLAILAAALLAGCATSTPQSRIESNPQLYNSLSPSKRALVSQGKITEGMTTQEVFLAWGKADVVKTTSTGGSAMETWIYTGQEAVPVYSTGWGGWGGYGWGDPYYRSSAFYCSPGPSWVYQSYVAGKVTFKNGRATQWEVTRRR